MDTFDKGLYIDGVYYDVPILKCQRTANFLWKFADRTEEGEHVGEKLGTFMTYTIEIGKIVNMTEYNRLYQKLIENKEYHIVQMPSADGSMFTFEAYFASVKDNVRKSYAGKTF